MNRHGISLNPTQEESALLRRLWDADDARARSHRYRREVEELRAENTRLRIALRATEPPKDAER